jgi:hypothetical protein
MNTGGRLKLEFKLKLGFWKTIMMKLMLILINIAPLGRERLAY